MANLRKRSQRDVVQGGRGLQTPCLFGRHKPADHWVMRPALVGAGVVIPKVHFDRACLRCRQSADRVWADIVGVAQPQEKAMSLAEWMAAQGLTVPFPPGEVRVPDQAEIAALVAKAEEGR